MISFCINIPFISAIQISVELREVKDNLITGFEDCRRKQLCSLSQGANQGLQRCLSSALSHPAVEAGRAVPIKALKARIQGETVSKKIRSFSFSNALNNVCIIVVKQEEITCQAVCKVAVTGMCAS